jgi:hypothetical protein
MSGEIVQVQEKSLAIGRRGISITTIDDLRRFCETVAKSGLAPKGLESPAAIAVAIEMGLELGLPPMAALQNIAVVNGRPCVFGDAALAICKSHPDWDEAAFQEELIRDGNGQVIGARCTVRRKPGRPVSREFTIEDAKRARLWGKDGPWTFYPNRMLQMRARSWALRDTFPDVLKGIAVYEEAQDIPVEPVAVQVIEEPQSSASRADRLANMISGNQVDKPREDLRENRRDTLKLEEGE